jgi:membrane protease YdiL (CAAX protease family)
LLFYQVCFIAAPAEELFFRGIVQDAQGHFDLGGALSRHGADLFRAEAPLVAA